MEVNTEKTTRPVTNSTHDISADISRNGQKLKEVATYKYLEATISKDSACSAEMIIRIASAMETMARLNRIWQLQVVYVFCRLYLPVSLRGMDSAC